MQGRHDRIPYRTGGFESVSYTHLDVYKRQELQTEYAKLLEEKKKTYAEYRRSREEMRELLTTKANVDRVLKMEVEPVSYTHLRRI